MQRPTEKSCLPESSTEFLCSPPQVTTVCAWAQHSLLTLTTAASCPCTRCGMHTSAQKTPTKKSKRLSPLTNFEPRASQIPPPPLRKCWPTEKSSVGFRAEWNSARERLAPVPSSPILA